MTSAPNLPSIVAARYVPIRLIAQGGMGAVYEVEHARTGEHLALKVLLSGVGSSAEALERFKREARASARIKSEHVVRVSDADVAPELGGAPFLVMELLDGLDLERAAKASALAPATVVEWLKQVAPAIDKAHRLGIVHRDLKPENLFLANGEGRAPIVKILDFGIVKMAEDGTGATGSGQILGTPRYMAPEQASPHAPVTAAVDRCALGLVAYRLLTGESYYQGDMVRILAQLLHEPLQPPSKRNSRFGSAFDAWFLKACHRWPQERFASAVEQIEALSAALGLPASALDPASQPTISGVVTDGGRRSRRALPLALTGLLLAAVAGGTFLQKRQRRSSPVSSGAVAVPPPAAVAAQPVPVAPREAQSMPVPPLDRPLPAREARAKPFTAVAVTSSAVPHRTRDLKIGPTTDTEIAKGKSESVDPYADQK
jgi:serine/threonine protein kinase